MSRDDDPVTFHKTLTHDDEELVGAQWWRESERLRGDGMDRRAALLALAGLSAAGAVMTLPLTACTSEAPPPEILDRAEDAIQLQKQYGWDFGAEGKPLDYGDGTLGEPVDPARLDALARTLAPTNPKHEPWYQSMLFQVLSATPTTPSNAPHASLKEVIRPLQSKEADAAFAQGAGLSSLFDGAPPGKIVIIDLPGAEAVAMAAALSNRFDPVFTFDNWPHPQGIVPAHRTLATALHYLDELERTAAARHTTAPPVFVLDANRLAPFSENTNHFDNRYVAMLPNAQQLQSMGVKEVLYVRPTRASKELDDINQAFVDYRAGQIEVRLVAAADFGADPDAAVTDAAQNAAPDAPLSEPAYAYPTEKGAKPPGGEGAYAATHHHSAHHHYGSSLLTHWFFWHHYGWGASRFRASEPAHFTSRPDYTPTRRATSYGKSARPPGFGQVNVASARGSTARPSLSSSQSKGLTSRSTSGSSSTTRSSRGTTRGGSFGRSSGGRSGG